MELHGRLTIIGAVLLVATLALNYTHEEGFNYAYVPGVGMLGAFAAGLVLFTRERLRE